MEPTLEQPTAARGGTIAGHVHMIMTSNSQSADVGVDGKITAENFNTSYPDLYRRLLVVTGTPASHAENTAASYPDLYMNVWINQDEIPSANSEVRNRFFSIVDRTQLAEGVVILTSSIPGGASDGKIILWVRDVDRDPSAGERIGPFFQFKGNRLEPSGSESPRPTILLQRLANPTLPSSELQGILFIAKQQALRDRLGEADGILVGGVFVDADSDSTAALRNLVTTLSADVDRPAGPYSFANDGRASGL